MNLYIIQSNHRTMLLKEMKSASIFTLKLTVNQNPMFLHNQQKALIRQHPTSLPHVGHVILTPWERG